MMMMMMMMMMNKRNISISILEINRKNIITLLNKLSCLSDGRHFKSRYVDVGIESLEIEYGS